MKRPRGQPIFALFLPAILTAQVSCVGPRKVHRPLLPPALRVAVIQQEAQEGTRRFDQPDEAREYYLRKRTGPGGVAADLVREYRRAVEHSSRMPRFESATGRQLSSEAQARQSDGIRRLADPGLLASWEFLGPGNIGGRTRALLVHPQEPEIMVAAGVSGGIWKTYDGGQSWHPVGDLLPNIAVNCMVLDPSDPRVMYAGTGEGYFREIVRGTSLPLRGEGIFKSEDAGDTWVRLESTAGPDFHWVNSLVASRNDPRRIYAATRTGVWRSPDAGRTWARILEAENVAGGCLHLALRTDRTTDHLFASCGTFQQATVYLNREAEGNGTWELVLSESGMGRTSLAIAASDQDVVYALSTSYVGGPSGRFNGGLHAVFRSDRGGEAGSWYATVRNTSSVKLNTLLLTNALYASARICGLDPSDSYSTLGWYTNVIAVDPLNPEIVWAGGVDLFRSDDGGRNWGPVTHWFVSPPSAHADQHVIAFHPGYDGVANQTLFVGGDGGVWRTDNARAFRSMAPHAPCSTSYSQVEWTSLNHGYGVTQFYFGLPFPDGSSYLGGTQDNGTLLGSDTRGSDGWTHVLGGDGGYVAVNPRDPNIIYAEAQSLDFYKSVDGGRTFRQAMAGITEPRSNYLFIPPFVMDPNEPDRLWIGGRTIWRTNDGASSWEAAGSRLSETAKVSAIAVSPADSDRVLVGTSEGSIHRQDRATTASETSVWPSSRPRDGYVTWLAFDPVDPDVAYATYAEFGGKHVWKTSDGGHTWISLDGEGERALPDIPVHSLVVHPRRRGQLYVGTDLGVFTSGSGGNVWAVENTGFAHVVTEALHLQQQADGPPLLWAFTHGRGAWRVALALGGDTASCNPDRWIAHVTPPGVAYQTQVIATNSGPETARVELVPFREDGSRLHPVVLALRPNETVIASSGSLFAGQTVSHFGVCGATSVSVTAAYRSTTSLSATAHVPETSALGYRFLVYPGEPEVVFDGVALVNAGAEPGRVEAVLLDESGDEIRRIRLSEAIAPKAKRLALLGQEFAGARGSAVRIESSQPSVVLMLRGILESLRPIVLYETVPVIPGSGGEAFGCSPWRWILHVPQLGKGYRTTMLATNLATADAEVELIPFGEDGGRLTSGWLRVAAGDTVISPIAEVFPSVNVSHFGICGSGDISVAVAYRRDHLLSASAHVPETSRIGTRFLVHPAEWGVVYEGFALVNRGSRPARVEAVLLDSAGTEMGRATLAEALAPGAKSLGLFDSVFAGLHGVAIRIESSEPLSALLLRGTHGDVEPSLLYQTLPVVVAPPGTSRPIAEPLPF